MGFEARVLDREKVFVFVFGTETAFWVCLWIFLATRHVEVGQSEFGPNIPKIAVDGNMVPVKIQICWCLEDFDGSFVLGSVLAPMWLLVWRLVKLKKSNGAGHPFCVVPCKIFGINFISDRELRDV